MRDIEIALSEPPVQKADIDMLEGDINNMEQENS